LEKAPKDLDSPLQHEWKHGDVFLNEHDVIMISVPSTTMVQLGYTHVKVKKVFH
ncbi:hypothetical protein LCGC14_2153200, partial [marine sediment metagenome]